MMEDGLRVEAPYTEDARYRLLVGAITDYAIYMLDPNGRVTSWNPGAERLKGYSAAEILGQNFSRFYDEDDRRAGIPARNLAIAAREGRYEQEGWRIRKDGSRFWASVVIDPIWSPSGGLVGFAKITRDLTERRDAQRALEEAREALMQAQKMEIVGQLTGGVAHDFNNLLAAVLGSLELLRRRLPENDPKAVELLDNAVRGAERGAALTQRMLAFARRQELKLTLVDLGALLRGMTGLLQQSLGPSVNIDIGIEPGLAPIRTDPHQLESALLNLMVNARDAMPDGGVISVGTRNVRIAESDAGELMPGHYVCLTVRDSGEGMSAETLARAAEPFFTTKVDGKGTGLGLPMVQGLAQQSGGRLVLKSRKGVGTTAELWLQAAEAGEISGDGADPSGAGINGAEPVRLVALAVDDDPLVLVNMVAMLEDLGHTVLQANSARQALEVLRERRIDLVITDQAMPRMSGLQLVQSIAEKWPQTPAILVSGYAELPASARPRVPMLGKPFRQEQLVQAIAEALRSTAAA